MRIYRKTHNEAPNYCYMQAHSNVLSSLISFANIFHGEIDINFYIPKRHLYVQVSFNDNFDYDNHKHLDEEGEYTIFDRVKSYNDGHKFFDVYNEFEVVSRLEAYAEMLTAIGAYPQYVTFNNKPIFEWHGYFQDYKKEALGKLVKERLLHIWENPVTYARSFEVLDEKGYDDNSKMIYSLFQIFENWMRKNEYLAHKKYMIRLLRYSNAPRLLFIESKLDDYYELIRSFCKSQKRSWVFSRLMRARRNKHIINDIPDDVVEAYDYFLELKETINKKKLELSNI